MELRSDQVAIGTTRPPIELQSPERGAAACRMLPAFRLDHGRGVLCTVPRLASGADFLCCGLWPGQCLVLVWTHRCNAKQRGVRHRAPRKRQRRAVYGFGLKSYGKQVGSSLLVVQPGNNKKTDIPI